MALWYASSTNPGERGFRARLLEVNQDVMSVSDQVRTSSGFLCYSIPLYKVTHQLGEEFLLHIFFTLHVQGLIVVCFCLKHYRLKEQGLDAG